MTNYARFEERSARLADDFGLAMARRYFGDMVDDLPRYVRGPRKGKLKGWIRWRKCAKGGWVRTGPYIEQASGYVTGPGMKKVWIEDKWADEEAAFQYSHFVWERNDG